MAATLATDIDDPLERIRAIHASTQSAKELTEAVEGDASSRWERWRRCC